jgi:type IV pilus assembly protein PilC
MPDFSYVARNNKTGATDTGVISAGTAKAAADTLRSQGMTPMTVKETKKGLEFQDVLNKLTKIKLLDKITFIKNLGIMVKAGLPVSKSLKILTEETTNKKFAKIIGEISKGVESGSSLSEALSKYPNVFSNIFVSMVKVGEVSGNLEQNLGYLSEQMQRDYNLISKAKGAMTYPVVVMVALALVGFTMFTFVLPKLTSTFKDFDVELPIMTKIVIALVDIFAAYGLIIFPFIVAAVIGFMYWRKTGPGKVVVHKVILYIPVLGKIVKKINLARFLGIFSSLLKSGMPIVDSLNVAGDVVANIYYRNVITEASAKVKVGSPLPMVFKKNPQLFDPLVVQMMEVGEESGTTDTVLAEIAHFYEGEVDQVMKNLSSILEPVLMLVIGIVVGILAVALISPIYSITQNV